MDPITKAYLEVLNESVPSSEVKTDLKVGAPFGDKQGEKNVTNFQKGTGPEEVEGVEDAKEASGELNTPDSSLKKLAGVKEAKNPFDALFNKIVSEETFNFSTQPNNELESDNAFGDSLDLGDSSEEDSDVEEFMDSDSEGEEVTLTINKEMAEKLMEILQAAMGEGEEEGEEGEEESDEMNDEEGSEEESEGSEEESEDEEETYPESFALDDAEELGEPLVDIEKLNAGMNNPKNGVVSGNIKAGKKHAETPQVGKGADGKLKSHNVKKGVSLLTKKKQEVSGGVNKGKMFFDNK